MAKKIDFTNKRFLKLKRENVEDGNKVVGELLIENEQVLASFSSIRDKVVFTNGRIISVNVQGLTGMKRDFTSIPYSKIQMYSVETAGTVDFDSELTIWISGMGEFKFEFTSGSDIVGLSKMMSRYIL
ncbi:MAG: PH domain-containing protein [Clostridiales bacterium]|nr:PH domain-containing protein [Clostridiales bacterium]